MVNEVNTHQTYNPKEDFTHSTDALESVVLITTINTHKIRDVDTVDIPNTFVQTYIVDEFITILMQAYVHESR